MRLPKFHYNFIISNMQKSEITSTKFNSTYIYEIWNLITYIEDFSLLFARSWRLRHHELMSSKNVSLFWFVKGSEYPFCLSVHFLEKGLSLIIDVRNLWRTWTEKMAVMIESAFGGDKWWSKFKRERERRRKLLWDERA